MTPAPRDDDVLTSFSDKCSEHGYLVQMVKETRTAQMSEIQEARSWRERTTGELYNIKEAIAEHVAVEKGRSEMAAEVTGEAEIIRKRNWTKLKWAVGVALAAAPGVWVVMREIWS